MSPSDDKAEKTKRCDCERDWIGRAIIVLAAALLMEQIARDIVLLFA